MRIRNTLQTNGVLLNEDWYDFLLTDRQTDRQFLFFEPIVKLMIIGYHMQHSSGKRYRFFRLRHPRDNENSWISQKNARNGDGCRREGILEK